MGRFGLRKASIGGSFLPTSVPTPIIRYLNDLLKLVQGGTGSDSLHTHPHTAASHSDQGATGTELETLTDGSNAQSLHIHTVASVCYVETGQYEGDGSLQLHVALADSLIQVKYVKVWERVTTDSTNISVFETTNTIVDDHASGLSITTAGAGPSGPTVQDNNIKAAGAVTGQFTVDDAGGDHHPNKFEQLYNYLVIGTKA